MIPSWKDNFFIFWSFWLHVSMYRLLNMNFVDQMVRKITSLLKFSSIVEEHLYESHPYLQYSRKYDFKNFLCYSPLRDHFSIFWHFWVLVRLFWSTCVDQMFSKLIWRESSLQEEQKTYLNHAHICNTRGVTIKRILNATAR